MKRRSFALSAMLGALALPMLALAAPPARAADGLTVFAAASLTDAMKEIGTLWAAEGHAPLKQSFGASSALARQIEQGAPAQIFASADQKWMDYLVARKLIAEETRTSLLGNDLVLIVPATHPVKVAIDKDFDFLKMLGPDGRIATGDPKAVPVGLYAKQALTNLGVWDKVSPRIAATEDVRGALLLVERGEAPLGIVYATDAAISKGVMVAGTFPASSHDPVTYPFAVTKAGDGPEARALLTFLAGPQAQKVFAKYGFDVLKK